MPLCKKCKSELDAGSKFCSNCGLKADIPTEGKNLAKSTSLAAKSKTQKNNMIIIPVILAGLIIAFFVMSYISGFTAITKEGGLTGKIMADVAGCRDVQVPYEDQEEYLKTEYYTETVPYTDKECESKTLTYSITDFILLPTICNTQEEVCHKSYPVIGCTDKTVYCVDRTVSCRLNINNLDDERGSWTIKFNFNKVGSSTVDATDIVSEWLYPKSSEYITGTARITSKELLDTRYTCTYLVTQEPTKQVCRDIIKYKDVQKERQVTAYRPVTRYKTEQKC